MKRALIVSAIVVISFVAGVAACFVSTTYRSRKPTDSIPAQGAISYRCPSAREVIATGRYVVVAVPNNREFYIGKDSLPLTSIPDRIRQSIGDLPVEQRTVFVKGEPGVKYETVSAVIHTIHDADVDRIEVVPIPKKPLQ